MLLAVVTGALVGAAAALLVRSIDWVAHGFTDLGDGLGLGQWLPLVSVPAGLLIAWFIANSFAREVAGDGVPEAMAGLTVHGGYISSRIAPFKILATAATLGGGASAGREGPIVQIGSSIGSAVARYTGLREDQVRSLIAAGAGAGIGASFNAPIAGMLFAMEVILGGFSIRHLNAVVVASVSAAVTFGELAPAEDVLTAFQYRIGDSRELLLFAGIGVIAVPVAILFLKAIDRVESLGDRFRAWPWLRPVTVGLVIAGLGIAEPHLLAGGGDAGAPRILGTGQEFVRELVNIASVAEYAWWVLLALAGLKVVATAVTLGGRGSGGAFMPSLFIGAALGAGVAKLVEPVWGWSTLRPGAFAVVGMAAVFAAVARAPLTSIIIVFEVTGDYALVLPLMLAASLATLLTDWRHPLSVYTMPLHRRGIRLFRSSEVDLLDTVQVRDSMSPVSRVVRPGMSLAEADLLLETHHHHGLPVVADGRLVGLITISDIIRAGGPTRNLTVADVMTSRPVTITPAAPVSAAMERMASLGVGRIPVVAEDEPTKLIGMFRREDAVRAYHHALASTTAGHLYRDRLRRRTSPGADFFDFRIPPGSFADGKQLREVVWPEGCTIVSVRTGRTVTIPTGDTVFASGDVVTAFGTPNARHRVIERLNATAEEPTAEIELVELDGEE
jgi:CIC family chloride channel protein